MQYEGIIAEHKWCREKAALFDICHMGEFLYRGDIREGGLEDVFTFSVAGILVIPFLICALIGILAFAALVALWRIGAFALVASASWPSAASSSSEVRASGPGPFPRRKG